MTTDDLLAIHQKMCDRGREIMRAKNHDYTGGTSDSFSNFRASEILGIPAELGILVRVLDKLKRIQTFVNQGTLLVKGESVDDAIVDVINYMILLKGLIESKGESKSAPAKTGV